MQKPSPTVPKYIGIIKYGHGMEKKIEERYSISSLNSEIILQTKNSDETQRIGFGLDLNQKSYLSKKLELDKKNYVRVYLYYGSLFTVHVIILQFMFMEYNKVLFDLSFDVLEDDRTFKLTYLCKHVNCQCVH